MAANFCTLSSRIVAGTVRKTVSRSCAVASRNMASQVELTSVRYKEQESRGSYAALEEQDIKHFENILGKPRVISDLTDLEGHKTDRIGIVRGW